VDRLHTEMRGALEDPVSLPMWNDGSQTDRGPRTSEKRRLQTASYRMPPLNTSTHHNKSLFSSTAVPELPSKYKSDLAVEASEIAQLRKKYDNLKIRKKQLQSELEDTQHEILQLQKMYSGCESDTHQAKNKTTQVQLEIQSVQQQLAETNMTGESYKHMLRRLENDIPNCVTSVQHIEEELRKIVVEQEQVIMDQANLKQEKTAAKGLLRQLSQQLDEMQQENGQTLGVLLQAHVSLMAQAANRQRREETRLQIVQEAKGDLNAAGEAKLRKVHTTHLTTQRRLKQEMEGQEKLANELQEEFRQIQEVTGSWDAEQIIKKYRLRSQMRKLMEQENTASQDQLDRMKEQNKKLKEMKASLGEKSCNHRRVYQDMGDAEFALAEVEKRLHHEGEHVNDLNIAIDASTTCLIKCYKKLTSTLEMTVAGDSSRHLRQAITPQKDEDPMATFVDSVESKLQRLLDISTIDIDDLPKSLVEKAPSLTALDRAIMKASKAENVEYSQLQTTSQSNVRICPRLADPKGFVFDSEYKDRDDNKAPDLSDNVTDVLSPAEGVVDRDTTKKISDLIVSKAKKSKIAQRQKGKKGKSEDDE